jgi:hypothetical protein
MTVHGEHLVSFWWRVAAMLPVSVVLLALGGCGNGLSQVSGQVTLDGQPVHGGKGDVRVTVQFQPADGVGANAIGLADEEGNYKVATGSQIGIRPGDYFVTCSVSTLGRGGPVADPKYANAKTSGLRFTVQPGKNEFKIQLQSPSKTGRRTSA